MRRRFLLGTRSPRCYQEKFRLEPLEWRPSNTLLHSVTDSADVELEVRMRTIVASKLYPVSEACKILGVSYPALKQWIYKRKIKTVKTRGGHHRIPESEIDWVLPPLSAR